MPPVVTRPKAPPEGPVSFSDLAGLAFDETAHPGEELMRRDEARLAAAAASHAPTASMLWFAWDRPTITLGRLQAATAVDRSACAAAGVPVVRRPTGGRAVLHAEEWTYAAVVPLTHPVFGGSLAVSCRRLVALVSGALHAAYGIEFDAPTASVAGGASGPEGACFARAFGYEAMIRGRKLMGSAQRRVGGVLLQQGSLLVGPGHERLARYLAPNDRDAEARLAEEAITLREILGAAPDPTPFHAALASAWRHAGAVSARSA